MLHDPRHDKKPSMAGFALFVATKDPSENYDWPHCTKCAVGQYLSSIGESNHLPWNGELEVMNTLARGAINPDGTYFSRGEWTFGKLADRILKHQMETA